MLIGVMRSWSRRRDLAAGPAATQVRQQRHAVHQNPQIRTRHQARRSDVQMLNLEVVSINPLKQATEL